MSSSEQFIFRPIRFEISNLIDRLIDLSKSECLITLICVVLSRSEQFRAAHPGGGVTQVQADVHRSRLNNELRLSTCRRQRVVLVVALGGGVSGGRDGGNRGGGGVVPLWSDTIKASPQHR